ncbi:hypothetical protein AMS68_000701 [Peltaster fructicola]|uniref:RBR-type E3 ubiquitin transferase n=1 Tax=Peltaster fructicola TaxID=286661 RepID=A0A6H0XKC5_9PEZI|nr:hypothetical protein AMS68_000701 [Peltaster fructicola]
MARSTVGTRSAAGSRSTKPSQRRSSAARHHRASEVEAEPVRPDAHQIRRLREAYFGQPARERAMASTASRKATSATKEAHEHKKSSGSSRTRSRQAAGKKPDRTTEYVYGTAPAVEVIEEEEDVGSSPSSRKHQRRPSSLRADSSSLLDVEVTPSDSVSQIGSRRHRKTMRTSLRSVSEKPLELPSPKSRRDSFLGSIFGKRTSVAPATSRMVECLTCGADDVPAPKAAKLECGHRMCHSCLKRIFKLAVQDPAHMPPKCCTDQHIPLKLVDNLFDLKFKLLFNKKFDEYRTKNRVYCPNRKCGVWIRPAYYHTSNGRRFAQCNRCKTKACISCGMKLHKTRECPKDPEIAKLVEQAAQQGWKQCYSCNAMVELREGCNHMTCRCTAEFCMVCGAKWKTCDCAWFNPITFPRGDGVGPPHDPFAFVQQLLGEFAAHPARGYRQEMNERRRQVTDDEDLARRMQFANLLDPEPHGLDAIWGVGNGLGHHMNDDFVQDHRTAIEGGQGELGRRGERSANRRRDARAAPTVVHAGLADNFLGEPSVLGGR